MCLVRCFGSESEATAVVAVLYRTGIQNCRWAILVGMALVVFIMGDNWTWFWTLNHMKITEDTRQNPWVDFFFFFKGTISVFYFKPKRNIVRLFITDPRVVLWADVLQNRVLIRRCGLDRCVSQTLDLIVNNKSGEWEDICVLKQLRCDISLVCVCVCFFGLFFFLQIPG